MHVNRTLWVGRFTSLILILLGSSVLFGQDFAAIDATNDMRLGHPPCVLVLDFFQERYQADYTSYQTELSNAIMAELHQQEMASCIPGEEIRGILSESGYQPRDLYNQLHYAQLGRLMEADIVIGGKYRVTTHGDEESLAFEIMTVVPSRSSQYFYIREEGKLGANRDDFMNGFVVEYINQLYARCFYLFEPQFEIPALIIEPVSTEPEGADPVFEAELHERITAMVSHQKQFKAVPQQQVHRIINWLDYDTTKLKEVDELVSFSKKLNADCSIYIEYTMGENEVDLEIIGYDIPQRTRLFRLVKYNVLKDNLEATFRILQMQIIDPMITAFEDRYALRVQNINELLDPDSVTHEQTEPRMTLEEAREEYERYIEPYQPDHTPRNRRR